MRRQTQKQATLFDEWLLKARSILKWRNTHPVKQDKDGTKVTCITEARNQMKQCGILKRIRKIGGRNLYKAEFAPGCGFDCFRLDDGYRVEDVEVYERDGRIVMLFRLTVTRSE